MPAPVYSDADHLATFQALLPTGPVWPRDADAVQTQALAPLVRQVTRHTARAANLLSDAFPVAPLELLPEWEETLGLPDPCAGLSPTVEARQRQVNARFIASGGQSQPYFIAVAAALGYQITITQFTPSRFGHSFGLPFGGVEWAFAWEVNAPGLTANSFLFGRGGFGEPFASWSNDVLTCEIRRLAPAHTTVLFSYQTAQPTVGGLILTTESGRPILTEAVANIVTDPI